MTDRAIVIRVEVMDATTRSCRLLVVKHAQRPYGLDRRIVATLDVPLERLPVPGAHLAVDTNGRIAASSVLFIGVPGLHLLDYEQIREFGERAVAVAAEVAPDAQEVCLTLHGPGYGLDEAEAFSSEVAGLAEAISSDRAAPALRTVTFLERDERRAARMRTVLAQVLSSHRVPQGKGAMETVDLQRLRTIGLDSRSKRHAFVAMPFDSSFEDLFHYAVAPAIRETGYLCERIDKIAFTGDVVSMMKERISTATFAVADISDSNPNVYLEIGYAWGRGVPCVLIAQRESEMRFDVRGQRCIVYQSIRDLEKKLSDELEQMFT